MTGDTKSPTRRRFGVAFVTALAIPTAGCFGDDEDDGETNDDTTFDTTVLWVTAVDEEDGEPVSGATVTVLDGGGYEEERETESTGSAFFDLDAGEYGITVETEAGSVEATTELEEGDDGDVEVEVPTPDEEE